MRRLRELKNKYNDERIFLVGNGPSLNETPLYQLDDEYTLAMNRIHHIYESTDWRPSFYLNLWSPSYYLKNMQPDSDEIEMNLNLDIPCFIDSRWEDKYDHENVYLLRKMKLLDEKAPIHRMSIESIKETPIDHLYHYWSDDISELIYDYHSMYIAAQIAVYLGFKEIYIIGADLGMEYHCPHMIFESGLDPYKYTSGKFSYIKQSISKGVPARSFINGLALIMIQNLNMADKILSTEDNSHFSSDYLSEISVNDRTISEKEIVKSHVVLERLLKNQGIKIYNATIGGELDVYERRQISDILDYSSKRENLG